MAGKRRRSRSQGSKAQVRTAPPAVVGTTSPADPVGTLVELRRARAELAEQEHQAVLLARAQGATWEAIGDAMGLRRQAVWLRYGEASSSSGSGA